MRLIDADALKENIKECMTVWNEHSDYGIGRLRAYEWAIELIDNAPKVERPIRGIAKLDKNGDIKIEELPNMNPCGLTDEQFERLTNAVNSICDGYATLVERLVKAIDSIDWETISKAIKEAAEQEVKEDDK